MSLLRIVFFAAFMATVVLSKPIIQSEAENSSNESSETNSSEEAHAHVAQPREPIQAASEEEVVPVSVEETEPPGTEGTEGTEGPEVTESMLPSVDASPTPAMLYTTAPPDLMDPQTSTDPGTLMPLAEDPLQTTISTLIQNSTGVQPDSEVTANTGLTDTHLTDQLQVTTTTYQGLIPDATTPISPHTIKPSPQPSSTSPPISVPIRASMTAVPVCFTLQFSTTEPEPARGDSI